MTRPIRFRAWDYGNGMLYDVYPTDEREYVYDFKKNIKTKVHEHIMQFTGLLDRHGKEIYEGDIFPSAKGNWVIKFGAWDYWDGKKLVQMYGWYAECLSVEGKSHDQKEMKPLYASQVEVIGNTYSNPELLK